jgi:ferredoxin
MVVLPAVGWAEQAWQLIGGEAVRVIVDRDRCEGNAVCMGIAPDIFELDDEDYAVVKTDPIPPDREQLAEQAIAECPRAALLRED